MTSAGDFPVPRQQKNNQGRWPTGPASGVLPAGPSRFDANSPILPKAVAGSEHWPPRRPAPQQVWGARSTRRDRNAAYDNNAAVANSAALIEARNAASAKYRRAHPHGLDIPYAPDARTAFDLYPAPPKRGTRHASSSFTAVIGSAIRASSSPLLLKNSRRPGWSVAMPGYTRSRRLREA